MCRSTVDIQSATAEISRGKKIEERRRKKPQDKNIMPPITQAGHNKTLSRKSHCNFEELLIESPSVQKAD